MYSFCELHRSLIAGGRFTTVGSDTVNNVAAWDGSAWWPLAKGINGGLNCVAVWQGDLYVGGNFDEAGGVAANNIARWILE